VLPLELPAWAYELVGSASGITKKIMAPRVDVEVNPATKALEDWLLGPGPRSRPCGGLALGRIQNRSDDAVRHRFETKRFHGIGRATLGE